LISGSDGDAHSKTATAAAALAFASNFIGVPHRWHAYMVFIVGIVYSCITLLLIKCGCIKHPVNILHMVFIVGMVYNCIMLLLIKCGCIKYPVDIFEIPDSKPALDCSFIIVPLVPFRNPSDVANDVCDVCFVEHSARMKGPTNK
jgi:hypothetical protein